MINHQIIATGSKGNAVILGDSILIDCGVPFSAVKPYLPKLKLVLLTHIHGDHFKASTLKRMSQERPLLRFGACEWLIKPLVDAGIKPSQIDVLECGYQFVYFKSFSIVPFALHHDVPNCGYKVIFPGGKAIYATDTGHLDDVSAPDFDLYLIESNYREEEIKQRIAEKQLAGQYAYEYRVIKTHLSQEQCDEFIARNASPFSEYVCIHRHIDQEEGGQQECLAD